VVEASGSWPEGAGVLVEAVLRLMGWVRVREAAL